MANYFSVVGMIIDRTLYFCYIIIFLVSVCVSLTPLKEIFFSSRSTLGILIKVLDELDLSTMN